MPTTSIREFISAAGCEVSSVTGGAQNTQGALSAAEQLQQYLDKRNGAVQSQRQFTKPIGPCASRLRTQTFCEFMRFGWDVGDGRRRDSEGGKLGPEEVAERPRQDANGSGALLHD